MRRFVLFLISLLTLSACGGGGDSLISVAPPLEALTLELEVEQGSLQGVSDDEARIYQYLGIPFARPPVGELRWQAPQPAESWTGVRDASAFGNACIQADLNSSLTESEDCLYLNIAAPAAKPEQLRPVMVWFHGGGDDNGAGHEAIYAIDKLAAATGHVVVSVNARLGFLGFMALSELKAESANGGVGNYHHQDQQAALQWLQNNLRRFNGDADNVTIFGESAGANGVCRHLASRSSDSLYKRAILQSSTCGNSLLLSESQSFDQGNFFSGIWGCDTAASRLDCLRGKSAQELRQALADAGKKGLLQGDLVANEQFRPRATLDNDSFERAISEGIAGLPTVNEVILGVTSNEMSLFLHSAAADAPADESAYRQALAALNPSFNAAIVESIVSEHYPCAAYATCADAFSDVLSDYVFVCPSLHTADVLAANGKAVYFYEFARAPNNTFLSLSIGGAGPNAPALGVPHASDLFYLWDFTVMQAGDAPEETVAAMQQYWGSFAASGEPGANAGPQWPRYSAQAQEYLRIAAELSAENDLRLAKCEFLRGL
jgi:para-nitrobenzyl esterase